MEDSITFKLLRKNYQLDSVCLPKLSQQGGRGGPL